MMETKRRRERRAGQSDSRGKKEKRCESGRYLLFLSFFLSFFLSLPLSLYFAERDEFESKEAREEDTSAERQEETGGDSGARLPSTLASKLTGVTADASRRPPRSPGTVAHGCLASYMILAERTPGRPWKKPRTIIPLTAGSSSRLISIRRWALSR